MQGIPLHPAIVHIPIGLALIIPMLAVGLLVMIRKNSFSRNTWAVVVAVQAIAFAGGLAAFNTGGEEEERVEDVVPESAIEKHEELAEIFLWLAGLSLAAGAAGLFVKEGKPFAAAAAASTLLSLGAAGAVMATGHEGGELVYQHGAAQVYATSAGTPGTEGTAGEPEKGEKSEKDGDDDDK